MTTGSSIRRFLSEKRLTVAGASRRGRKFGNTVVRELERRGYDLVLVHPEASDIDGRPCVPSPAELPDDVGGLVLVVPPEQSERLVEQAAAAGIERVWMQQGAQSERAVELCREHGVDVIHGECILMFADPTGIHRLHHWLWGLLGKLPEDEA